jgi:SpoVK/Ycf46/Vps4 family AAA+-type ATPase
MEIYKVAETIGGKLRFCGDELRNGWVHMSSGEIVHTLSSLESVVNPRAGSDWTVEISVEGRPLPLTVNLPTFVSVSDSLEEPIFLPDRRFVFYRNKLFATIDPPKTQVERDEILAEVKERVLRQTGKQDELTQSPRIPKGHVKLWADPELARDLLGFYGKHGHIIDESRQESAISYAGNSPPDQNSIPANYVMLWAHPKLARDLADFYGKNGHIIFPNVTAADRTATSSSEAKTLTALSAVQRDIGSILDELDKLTGLAAVKRDVRSLVNYLRLQQLRKKEGLPVGQMTMHLVFTGNPGTGKTTVARLLAKIYKAMGFLPAGHLIETDRSGLVGEYLGHTAQKTLAVVQKALGGILFIDEAYALSRSDAGRKDMFGLEAIDTLLKAMEDNRDKLVVIVAGYPKEMKEFIASNPGLRSRFTRYIDFPDYTPAELMQIFQQQALDSGYLLSEAAQRKATEVFKIGYENRNDGFGNGRWVRTIFERASLNMSDRLADNANLTREHLMMLQETDIQDILS